MEQRTNIVLILADDMGYSDIGCFGSEIDTPNLNRMAGEGLLYSHMYNNARCCPSRASLLTGLYPHQAGIGLMQDNLGVKEYQGYLNNRCITIAEGVKSAGYQTAMIGKWHVGGGYSKEREALEQAGKKGYPTPMQRGFDYFYGTLEGAGNYYNPVTLMENGKWIDLKPEDDFYYTEKIGEKACEIVERFSESQMPFFMYIAFNAPHWPLHARERDIEKYEGRYLCGWEEIRRQRYQKQVRLGLVEECRQLSPRDIDAPSWEQVEDKEWEDIKMAVYAAQVDAMDQAIGRILDKFKALGIEENTLVVFLSDNGACAEELPGEGWVTNYASDRTLEGESVEIGNGSRRRPGGEDTYMSYGLPWANASNTPFRLFKHWIHEGGIAAPCIIQWKGNIKDPGRIIREPVHFIDIMPTFLEIADAAYPKKSSEGEKIYPLAGESIIKSFEGAWSRKSPIFWEHEGNCGIRAGKYKLVRKYPDPFELYDMMNDRTELTDLSEELPDVCRQLREMYERWKEANGVLEWETVLEMIENRRA